jgi:hypothetical protein
LKWPETEKVRGRESEKERERRESVNYNAKLS